MLFKMRLKLYFLIVLIGVTLVSIHATPSLAPSAIPSIIITDNPTVKPSQSKSPTEAPSASPTKIPSIEPSLSPSLAPSPMPSNDPTWKPSIEPSIAPSWKPTITPSISPSASPTMQPSVSMNPTSFPTSRNVERYIQCDNLVCEGESDGDCTYNSANVILECVDEFTQCEITTGAFTVGPNTQLFVSGGCELLVEASTTAIIHLNTTIKGTGITISSHGDVVIQGAIQTDGHGPLQGPGAPTDISHMGYGGTYGGSGGQSDCDSAYFTNTPNQIGSINVLDDIDIGDVGYNSTFGSGGGFTGGGHGGGRVILKTGANVVIYPTGRISADGSPAQDPSVGAGSGGSITISAFECVQNGVISARGGSTYSSNFDTGAAGGGGRVAIIMSSLNSTWTTFDAQSTNIRVKGGSNKDSCKTGASGTVYIQLGHGGIHSFNAVLWIANSGQSSYAVTTLDSIPSLTNILSISEYAIATSTQSLRLQPLPSCVIYKNIDITTTYTSDCSMIDINNGSFVVLSNETDSILHSEGIEWDISADSIRLMDSYIFGSLNTFYSFNITSKTFFLSETSSIKYSGRLHLRMKEISIFHGDLLQVEGRISTTPELAYYHHSYIDIYTGKNLFLSNVIANNLMISANAVNFTVGKGANSPPGYIPQACQVGVKLGQFTCSRNIYTGTLRYNNTFVIAATEWIDVAHKYSLVAAQVLLCAPEVNIHSGAEVSANQRGCVAAHGIGAGGSQSSATISSPYGAGGAGYGGMGGAGFNTNNGGTVYAVTGELSSGSGGGCLNCNRTYYGAGGGIINIVANISMFLNGNLTSNGGFGSTNAGGGSGGTVSINALTMKGAGHISVSGGSGGSGQYPGGGGGGGMLTIFNDVQYYLSYNYVGIVSAAGGQPGHSLLTLNNDDNTMTIQSPMLRTPVLFSIDDDDDDEKPSPAERGYDGVLNLPQCPPGYGNGESSGTVCGLCPAGTFAPGDGKNQCYYCNNKPTHAHYTTDGWTTSDCPYDCNTGYSTSDCYTPFQNFIFHTLGIIGIVFCSVGLLGLILLPLVYYRYKKEYGWFEETSKKTKITLPTDTFTHVDDDRINDKHRSGGRKSSIDMNIHDIDNSMIENPLQPSDSSVPVELEYPRGLSKASSVWEGTTVSTGSALPSAFKKMNMDLRLRLRLVEPDLVTHACRVNLLGSNHPNPDQGGPWHMPVCRPACLRPMLRKAEYRQLAERINRRVAWQALGWEMLLFYTIAFLVPPLAAFLMRQFRKRRGDMLLKILANYDYSCFRCPHQRASRNSLRIGISPDATLAYVDFLFDEDISSARMKPLCPIGQVRLPASFKLAGLGTYFSPYYIDTNDLILQAVPQTDIPSSFINTTWISFVVELNTILRTVQKDSLYFGVRRLIRFLSEEQHSVDLGGLVVEFCTFPNTETIYTSEATDMSMEDVLVQGVNSSKGEQQSQSQDASKSTASTLERRNTSWERWIMKQRCSDQANSNRHTNSSIPSPKLDRNSSINSNNSGVLQQSIDVAFTSPRESQDHRESMIKTSTKNIVSCYNWAMKTIGYYMKLLALYISYCDSHEPILTDSNGSSLSFIEMCDAIQNGQLKMGIVVTHPKVVASSYIVQDEDYESEEESFYNRGNDSKDEDLCSVNSSSMQSLPHVLAAATSAGANLIESSSTKQRYSSALRRTYGDKAEEVAKFYNIMVAADSNMAASNRGVLPYPASTSTSSSPVGQSTLADMVCAVKNPLVVTTASVPATLPSLPPSSALVPSTPARATKGIAATPEYCNSTTATAGEDAACIQHPPAEYTDFSPFRAMRRASKTNDRDSMLPQPRITTMSAPDDLPTDEDIQRFQSFKDISEQNEEEDDDDADSRDSNSRISEDQDYDENELQLPSDDSPDNNYQARKKIKRKKPISSKRGSALLYRNAPISLDRKSILSLQQNKRFSKRKCRDLSVESLAPSAFQHSINCWRLNDQLEFISDGIIRILLSNSYPNDSYNNEMGHSSIDHSSSGCSSVDMSDHMRNISTVARTGDRNLLAPNSSFLLTPNAKSRTSLNRNKQHPPSSPWYHIRSFLGATSTSKTRFNTSSNSISFSEDKSTSYNVDNKDLYSDSSSEAGSVVNHEDTSNTEKSVYTIKDIENAELNQNTTHNTTIMTLSNQQRNAQILQLVHRNSRRLPIVSNYKPFYFLRLLLFYVRNFMLGSNVYPIGPAYVRKILEILIFTMCIVDMALSIIVLTSAYCASSDATACTDHTSMILMVALWPGALLIAPVTGLTTVVLGPSGTLARIYAQWSRIACINSAMVVWSLVYYFQYYYNVPGSIYSMLVLPGSRVFQCLFVDLYIAHIERLRYTRGWDGLHTSLFKTQDNLQDVISD